MRAILLCAGFATRMRPLTDDFPKPLLPVAGAPILDDLVAQLVATGRFDELVIVSNHRFQPHFARWLPGARANHPDVAIDLVDDGVESNETRLGAVGDLALALRVHPAEGPTLVTAGDNLFRFDLAAFLDDHEARPRNLILAYREPDPERRRRCGIAEVDVDGRLRRLWEKPEEPPSDRACPPFYLLERSALARLPEYLAAAPGADAPGHFIAWLCRHDDVYVHDMRGERLDVGDLATYRGADAWLAARGPAFSRR